MARWDEGFDVTHEEWEALPPDEREGGVEDYQARKALDTLEVEMKRVVKFLGYLGRSGEVLALALEIEKAEAKLIAEMEAGLREVE